MKLHPCGERSIVCSFAKSHTLGLYQPRLGFINPSLPFERESPVLEAFQPLLDAAQDLDLADANQAEAALRERFDPNGDVAQAMHAKLNQLLADGEIANRGELPVMWGRVAKPSPETRGFSIDVVLMTGPGPKHRHPRGEIDYCIALDGEPTFDGRQPGWVVLPEGSVHVPTVSGGKMLIVYLLPDGEMEFL